MDEGAVVERAKAGEAAAFQELFHRHRDEVARLVYRLLPSPPELEDLVQEVFLQVYRSLHRFEGKARFSTWLYRVTVNVVLMHRRAARSRPVLVEALTEPTAEQELPDATVEQRRRVAAFYELLERLTEKKRTVFVLHELEGLAPADIAKIVDAPVLTVRTRLFYARRELGELLREEPTLASLADELAAPEAETSERAVAREARREPS